MTCGVGRRLRYRDVFRQRNLERIARDYRASIPPEKSERKPAEKSLRLGTRVRLASLLRYDPFNRKLRFHEVRKSVEKVTAVKSRIIVVCFVRIENQLQKKTASPSSFVLTNQTRREAQDGKNFATFIATVIRERLVLSRCRRIPAEIAGAKCHSSINSTL